MKGTGTIRLYYPPSHYDAAYRGLVFPLLKPFLKWDGFSDEDRMRLYGVTENDYTLTDNLEQADVAILPMAWNYYVERDRLALANDFIDRCGRLQKKVLVLNAGDFGLRIPNREHLIIFRLGGYKSRFAKNEFTLPVFIEDPLEQYFQTTELHLRSYASRPFVGFCGQANSAYGNRIKETLKIAARNVKTVLGLSKNEQQQLLSTSFLRASVLRTLENSPRVVANFILRKKYRAGITTQRATHSTTLEFYNNLNESDYVVCVRGAGNFSVRFYEALAMGRIPVFVNTDCSLPLDHKVSWEKHLVWVPYGERSQVAEKIVTFHNQRSPEDFKDLQHQNRALWKEQLTLGGFFKSFLGE